jgi:hypothetical protein
MTQQRVYTTCYVEEELPGNTDEKENSTSNELPGEAAQQDRLQGQQGGSANEDKEETVQLMHRTSLHSSTRSI